MTRRVPSTPWPRHGATGTPGSGPGGLLLESGHTAESNTGPSLDRQDAPEATRSLSGTKVGSVKARYRRSTRSVLHYTALHYLPQTLEECPTTEAQVCLGGSSTTFIGNACPHRSLSRTAAAKHAPPPRIKRTTIRHSTAAAAPLERGLFATHSACRGGACCSVWRRSAEKELWFAPLPPR